jgi:ribosomal protein L7/L12
VREGRLIEAIKQWRELTGLTLAEAKRDIDELKRRLG